MSNHKVGVCPHLSLAEALSAELIALESSAFAAVRMTVALLTADQRIVAERLRHTPARDSRLTSPCFAEASRRLLGGAKQWILYQHCI